VWPTIFGAPDVPDVSINHSVARSAFGFAIARTGGQAAITRYTPASAERAGPVGHDGIDFGVFDQGVDVIHVEVGRTQQHAASHAIDLGYREAAD
jgi:hypothetical protein